MLADDEAWSILRTLDDPYSVEGPAELDLDALGARFGCVVFHLEESFGCSCSVDAGFPFVQDASHYGTVTVPAGASASGAQIVIRISRYGSLAVYELELFGVYDRAETALLVDPLDRDRIELALTSTGHDIVPADLLWTKYDGVNDYWQTHFPDEPTPTWFTRFFDWV